MRPIETSVTIDAPPTAVFDARADVRNELQWFPEAVRIDALTPGPIGAGSVFRSVYRRYRMRDELLRYERPTRLVVESRSGLSIRIVHDVTFEDLGDRTRVLTRTEIWPGWLHWWTARRARRTDVANDETTRRFEAFVQQRVTEDADAPAPLQD